MMKEHLARILAIYMGSKVKPEDIQVMADPHVDGVWAVRHTRLEADFVITVKGNSGADLYDSVEGVEEVVFSSWPPKTAGGLSNASH